MYFVIMLYVSLLWVFCIVTASAVDIPPVEHVGPWKMTMSSSQPSIAREFVVKHFNAQLVSAYSHATTDSDGNMCIALEWVAFTNYTFNGLGDAAPYDYQIEPFNNFQLHFVKHFHRHEGSISIATNEARLDALNAGFTSYHVFMDNRVVMEALDLDPICVSLAKDAVPFFTRLNPDGTSSLFVQVPHAGFFEIVGPHLSVTQALPWNRCESTALSPAVVAREMLDGEYPEPVLRPLRFVYAATNAAESAEMFSQHAGGQLEAGLRKASAEAGTGDCFDSYTVKFDVVVPGRKFEYQWVRWNDPEQARLRVEMETYLNDLHGNFSLRSGNVWNHYIDYHSGLHVADCAALTRRFDAAGIPYFFGRQLLIFGLYFKDSNGISYEFTCADDSSRCAINIEDWDWCTELEEPSVFGAPVFRLGGEESAAAHSSLHGELTAGGEPACRQDTYPTETRTVVRWRELTGPLWEYPVRYEIFSEFLFPHDRAHADEIVRSNIHALAGFMLDTGADVAEGTLPYNYMHLLRLYFADAWQVRASRLGGYDNTMALSVSSELSMYRTLKERLKVFTRGSQHFAPMMGAALVLHDVLTLVCPPASDMEDIDFRHMTRDEVYHYVASRNHIVATNLVAQRYVNDTLIAMLQRENACDRATAPRVVHYIEDCDLGSRDGGASALLVVDKIGREVDSMFSESWASSLAGGPDKYSIRLRMLTMSQMRNKTIKNMTMSGVLMRCSDSAVVSEVAADGLSSVTESERCEVLPQAMVGAYNQVIVTNALLLSPLALKTAPGPVKARADQVGLGLEARRELLCSMPPECAALNVRAPEALILGLGGAELQSQLVQLHRCMRVFSVDISADIVRTAASYFDAPLCEARDAAGVDLELPEVVSCAAEDSCRSRVLLGDASAAMNDFATQGRLFDYAVCDLYDLQVAEWDGLPDQGQSNPDGLLEAVRRLKSVLRPETGLALVHVHKDATFQSLLDTMRDQFEDVVVFQINANSNIVAGSMKGELVYQDPFDSSVGGKPCDDVVGMGAAVKSYIDYMGYAKASELSRHCVRCDL